MTYNKDLQEDKQTIFETFDIMQSIIKISGAVLDTLTVSVQKLILANYLTNSLLSRLMKSFV